MNLKIFLATFFWVHVTACNVQQVIKPLPTSQEYAKSLAYAMVEERKHNSAPEQRMSVQEVLKQWRVVEPNLKDEERYLKAAEILEQESHEAKTVTECHKQRFCDFKLFGHSVYENFKKPGSVGSYVVSFVGGAVAMFVALIATKK